ncbi:glycoside hydrolase family 3 N-terminal domain-containing protein [Microbacterium sp.]|uniref:glycoside hydrolase family 3 N-terminal domain-containing protein n=1 Tax=Microbacterium sp. TaxID=51671 RepID=UPI0028127653|nr:glycoside hydrolase family 3 N-terminal domain-containing protein [Microbacterium sp.]
MRAAVRGIVVVTLLMAALAGCTPPHTSPPSPTATAGASPSPTVTPTRDPAEAAVEGMTTAEQAASVVMGHVPTTDPAALRDYMASGPDGAPLGGFILMGANISGDAAQVRSVTAALTLDSALPPLIAIDQEGGVVSRLPWDDLPAGRSLQSSDAQAARASFAERASLVADVGANVNFGIVADVPADASSFIASRALGADQAAAADRVRAAVTGEKGVVFSTLKHFPGHGAAPGDSHHAIPSTPMSLEHWRESDARPFIAGIEAGAELLMFGHLAYTAVDAAPASLSSRWHEIAREELGFEGVLITDDLGMLSSSGAAYGDPVANAVAAIAAGNDMVLMIAGSTPDTAHAMATAIARAVDDGRLPAARLGDAAERVMRLRLQLSADSTD